MKILVSLITLFFICFGIYTISLLPTIDNPTKTLAWFLLMVVCMSGTWLGCVLFRKVSK